MSFWTDSKIMDDFSPEEKLMYLYLMTNPHTNLCGCYEISFRQMSFETGFAMKQTKTLVKSLESKQGVVRYSEETKEILLVNWSKYNWTSSDKLRKPLASEIASVKNADFKGYLDDLYNGNDTVSIPYSYCSDTTVTVTDTDTVPVTDTDYISITNLFKSICKSLPSIRGLNDQRKKQIKNLLKTYTVNDFETVFRKAEASDFLSGRSGKWQCGFDWLIKPSNFLKVLEGNYDNKDKNDALKKWAEGDTDGQEADSNIIDIPAFFVS